MPITSDSRSTLNRRRLSQKIKDKGNIMAPCSRCEKNGLQCRTLPESKRCGECVRSGSTKCDVAGLSPSDWDVLSREEARLEAEEEAAALAEQEAFRRRMEIRKKQKTLRDRGSEMLRRGVRSLDELDELLQKERVEKEKEAASVSVAVPSDDSFAFDSSSLDPSILASMDSPSFWANPGIAGGTPPTSQGS